MHLVHRIQRFKREAQPKYGLLANLMRSSLGKLPTSRQVLSVFFHQHKMLKKSVRDSARFAARKVLSLWNMAHIPTTTERNAVEKLEQLFDKWIKLKKISRRVVSLLCEACAYTGRYTDAFYRKQRIDRVLDSLHYRSYSVGFYYSFLAYVFSNFQYAPPLTLGRIYTPFIYGSTYDLQRSKTYFFFFFFLFYR